MCDCVCLADTCVNAHAFENIIGGHGQYLAFNRDGVKELHHFRTQFIQTHIRRQPC